MSYRPRGRGTSYRSSNTSALGRDLLDGLVATPLQTLDKPPLTGGVQDITLKNLQYIGSYNWKDSNEPTIIVPGSPPEWRNKELPYSVPADSGRIFIDQNGHRMKSAVLLPLITAVDIVATQARRPPFDWSSVSFISDRNNLRKLLSWIGGSGSSVKDFRIDFQLAGRTVLFNRWETRTSEISEGFSYGHSFEDASTTPAHGCNGSTGHHRIITYDFDGLKVVLRFEVDACYAASASAGGKRPNLSSADDLSSALAGMSLTPAPTSATTTSSGPRLRVIHGGHVVPQSSIIELTTRSEKSIQYFDWADAFPQLFLSHTPHQFIMVHRRGNFYQMREKSLDSAELRAIERRAQSGFKRLRRLLDTIRDLAIEHGPDARLSLVCRQGVLQVYRRSSTDSCLPDDILERFDPVSV